MIFPTGGIAPTLIRLRSKSCGRTRTKSSFTRPPFFRRGTETRTGTKFYPVGSFTLLRGIPHLTLNFFCRSAGNRTRSTCSQSRRTTGILRSVKRWVGKKDSLASLSLWRSGCCHYTTARSLRVYISTETFQGKLRRGCKFHKKVNVLMGLIPTPNKKRRYHCAPTIRMVFP